MTSNINTPASSLINFINEKVQLPKEVKEAIIAVSQTRYLNKKHLLVKEGMPAHHLFFIVKGSARTFYTHKDKDITSWIYKENQFVTTWSSFYTRTPSYENIELAEDAVIVALAYDKLQALYSEYPKMQAFGRKMVEDQLVFLERFYKGFAFMTAKEKYTVLLTIFPDVTQRINLGHIASFLGISQETLSRIRKR